MIINPCAHYRGIWITENYRLGCSFKMIPNGLRQHPLSVAIILSALMGALRGLTPRSLNYFIFSALQNWMPGQARYDRQTLSAFLIWSII